MLNKRDIIRAVGALTFGGTTLGGTLAGAMRGADAAPAKAPPANGESRPRKIPHGVMKTTRLFRAPPGHPNAMAVAPDGLWLGQQKLAGATARAYHLPEPKDLREAAWLVDWKGKLLKTVMTNSRNTSGMAYGDGCVWMMANEPPEGCFQVDMNGRQISHRQIPLFLPGQDGGGCHGAQWHDGKLWIVANRLRVLLRVDPKSWRPEMAIPIHITPEKPRWHDMTFDAGGNIWQITGNHSRSYREGRPGLVKYDGKTGKVLATFDFAAGSCDPHGLEFHNGTLLSCDAGIHPDWPNGDSPSAGWVFRIDPA